MNRVFRSYNWSISRGRGQDNRHESAQTICQNLWLAV